MTSFPSELAIYVGRIREFERTDWHVYIAWVGLMLGLVLSTTAFLLFGYVNGVRFPGAAWMVPLGAVLFAISIAIDTIGHRTIYKAAIARAEGLVHGITISMGISSCVLLCAAYTHRQMLWIPALVTTLLSVVYSFVDEAFHWHRYVSQKSDRVEMWSHVGILLGHSTMMLGWWTWFWNGYEGVAETVVFLSGSSR